MDDAFSKIRSSLGNVLRKRREALGYSQESFAEEIGLHRTYIGSIERGERNPSLKNLVKIAAALDQTLSELIAAAEKEDSSINLTQDE